MGGAWKDLTNAAQSAWNAVGKGATWAGNTLAGDVKGIGSALGFDGPPAPGAPPAPPPLPTATDLTDKYVQMARDAEFQKLLAARGRSSTFLTQGQSALAPQLATPKSVLG